MWSTHLIEQCWQQSATEGEHGRALYQEPETKTRNLNFYYNIHII